MPPSESHVKAADTDIPRSSSEEGRPSSSSSPCQELQKDCEQSAHSSEQIEGCHLLSVSVSPSRNVQFTSPINVLNDTQPPSRINNSTNEFQIGNGSDLFELKISIEKCRNLSLIQPEEHDNKFCWLSYRCFGTVVQSEIFSTLQKKSNDEDFTPMMDTFLIRSSVLELMRYFDDKKNATLRIHVCTEAKVLGTAFVDFCPLFSHGDGDGIEKKCGLEGTMVHGDYIVGSRSCAKSLPTDNACPPCIVVRVFINQKSHHNPESRSDERKSKINPQQFNVSAAVYSSISSQTSPRGNCSKESAADRATSPVKWDAIVGMEQKNDEAVTRLNLAKEKETELKLKELDISKKEKQLHDSISTLEKKRCEWEKWRHQEELNWHEKLRKKEAAIMRSIEERVCKIEKERLSSMDASRSEHEKLEARLRKALLEVEAKERQLKDLEVTHMNERKRKIAELDLREKLMKEELKHSIEIERAKANAALEQAVAAEKYAASAGKKVKQIELEMDQLRENHRKTPEVTLLQQVAELKGQLADSERRLESMKSEKTDAILEKEQFRANVHKLARALRHEREKVVAKRENDHQQVRLSYDANDKSFILGGGRDEVQRILSDLNKISQTQEQSSMGARSPLKSSISNSPIRGDKSCYSDHGVPNNNPPPTPMSHPHRPASNSSTPNRPENMRQNCPVDNSYYASSVNNGSRSLNNFATHGSCEISAFDTARPCQQINRHGSESIDFDEIIANPS